MNRWNLLAAAIISAALITGTVRTAQAANLAEAGCVGHHVSSMVRAHGGMAKATAHHNVMHDTNLSVGEHLALIRAMCDS